MTWTVLPHAHIPDGRAEREDMLFRAWEAIDDWIDHRRSLTDPPPGRSIEAATDPNIGGVT